MNNNVQSEPESLMSKRMALVAMVIFLFSVLTVLGYFFSAEIISFTEKDDGKVSSGELSVDLLSHSSVTENMIGDKWQWTEIKDKDEVREDSQLADLPFTAELVYQALQEVKISEDGNIVLDHTALVSLDEALERIYKKLDPDSLGTLQKLITEALPGAPGQQTAELVADYYHFLLAKHEFSRTYEPLVAYEGAPTVESIASQQSLYHELQNLREVHLGYEVAASLFQVSDADANFMFENMKIDADKSLTASQRQARRQEVQQTFIEQSIAIDNWPTRYRSFLQQKQVIINSQLAGTDKEVELSQLYNQYFNDREQQKIEHLRLDQI